MRKRALQDSNAASATSKGKGSSAANASVIVSDRSLSIAALVLSMVLLVFCYGLWSRVDLLRIFYDDIKAELIRQGMNPHPHMPTESP